MATGGNPLALNEGYTNFFEFAASFSVPVADADRVDVLRGIDPWGQRWMNSHEELDAVWPYLSLVSSDEILSMPEIRLWRRAFSEIDSLHTLSLDDLLMRLWILALRDVKVHATVYGYRSISDIIGGREFQQKAQSLARDASGDWASQVCEAGRSLFTMPLPKDGIPGKTIEEIGGLRASLKQRISLTEFEPGFVLRYTRQHEHELSDLFDSRQFEELAFLLFREEGWEVELTPRTHDGGKDVVAVRYEDGVPVIAYVEAKKYSRNPVRIGEVKEFVATLAGDRVERGFMMTTSHFTPDAVSWVETCGRHLAVVDFLSRSQLIERLAQHFDGVPRAFRMNGF